MHALPDPRIAPGAEVTPHRGPRWKLMGQGPPLASSAVQIQNGIDHFAHIGGSGTSSCFGRRDQQFEDPPLVLGHITGIASSHHLPTSSLPFFSFEVLFPVFLLLYYTIPPPSLPSRSPRPFISIVLSHLASQAFAHSLLYCFTMRMICYCAVGRSNGLRSPTLSYLFLRETVLACLNCCTRRARGRIVRTEIEGKEETGETASSGRSRLVAARGTMCRRPLGSSTITWAMLRLIRTGSSGKV